jgi:probable rRNA maturation factor
VNHIHGQADGVEHPLDRVEADALRLLELLGLDEVELSLVLCDDARIQALNRDYRGKDAPTDVLSFSMREGEEAEADDPVLGDLVISLDTAARQASELGHTLEDELRVLTIHGLLHLLGYDHERGEAEAQEMAARERDLLKRLAPDSQGAPLLTRSA